MYFDPSTYKMSSSMIKAIKFCSMKQPYNRIILPNTKLLINLYTEKVSSLPTFYNSSG